MSEALYLEWRDVDLTGGRAIFWQTKSGRRRNADLPPRIVATLSAMKRLAPVVFTTHLGRPYRDRGRVGGGQIKRAWAGALSRSGLDPELTPHDLRHTWATWHYALHKDLLSLREAGGWSTVTLVERYAHLAPAGHEKAIRRFLGTQVTRAPRMVAQRIAPKRKFAPSYSLGKGEVVGSIPTGSTMFFNGLTATNRPHHRRYPIKSPQPCPQNTSIGLDPYQTRWAERVSTNGAHPRS
jgi:Phage integrase family